MKGYYWLLIFYVVYSIGGANNIMNGFTSENMIYGYVIVLAIPTIIYLVIRNRKQKKLEQSINK